MRKLRPKPAVPPESRDARILAALNLWLAPNPSTPVREMAASVNLSQARFSHQFARTTGMLPGEFLRTLRRYHGERILALKIMREALLEKHPGDP